MKTRITANIEILEKLKDFFLTNPNIRFFQGLQILGLQKSNYYEYEEQTLITENFYEESTETLEKFEDG